MLCLGYDLLSFTKKQETVGFYMYTDRLLQSTMVFNMHNNKAGLIKIAFIQYKSTESTQHGPFMDVKNYIL